MDRRLVWMAAIGVLGAAAWLASLVLWKVPERQVEAAPTHARAAGQPERLSELVSPTDHATQERTEASVEVLPTTLPFPASTSSAPVRGGRVFVRGVVRASVPDVTSTVVWVRRADGRTTSGSLGTFGGRSHAVRPDGEGRFELEVTHYLSVHGVRSDSVVQLFVEAEHRSCELGSVALDIPPPPPAVDERAPALDQILEVELALERATCITGTVVVPAGHGVEQAVVTVFVQRPTGEWGAYKPRIESARYRGVAGFPRSDANSARPGPDGSYSIRVAPQATYAVVAALPGLRPQKSTIDVPVAGDYQVDFALDIGTILRGTLSLDGPPAGAGLTVNAALHCGDSEHVSLGSGQGTLCWIDGELEWSYAMSKTDARGRFELTGLCPRSYTLRAVGLGQPGQHARSVEIGEVRAPSDTVALGPVLARAVLDFGPPAERTTEFSLRAPSEAGQRRDLGPFECDELGLAILSLPPHTTFDVLEGDRLAGHITTGRAGSNLTWRIAR